MTFKIVDSCQKLTFPECFDVEMHYFLCSRCCRIHDDCYDIVIASDVCPWFYGPKSITYSWNPFTGECSKYYYDLQ